MGADKITISDNFFGMIKNLSEEVKLDLIKKISKSLKVTKKSVKDDLSVRELFGAWDTEKSAEEIIDDIREDRHINRKIEKL